MKLRIRGNSLRFRTSRSEIAKLLESGRIQETVFFTADGHFKLTYALEHDKKVESPTIRCQSSEVVIVLPTEQATAWATGDEVGIYQSIDLGARGGLDLIVEKDFACRNGSETDNVDTFPNPNAESSC